MMAIKTPSGSTTATNTVSDLAYGVGWEAVTDASASKHALFHKFESLAGAGTAWSEVTGTSQAAVANAGYIANNAGLVTVTLPSTVAVGAIIEICGKGSGLWKLAQNASQYVYFGNLTTTVGVGGYLLATHRRDAVNVVCTVADLGFTVLSSVGNLTIA
jgi:hypothetical protein